LKQTYVDTVRLLLFVAPRVFASGRLGLKGGTGLNLFIHDMPRLSIDIDAAYPDRAAPWELAIAAEQVHLLELRKQPVARSAP
jgi:hypothetical protein